MNQKSVLKSYTEELRIVVRLSIILATLVAILLMGGCGQNEQREPGEYTCTVVNKEIKSNSYILEITSPERHQYVDIAKEQWDAITIGDSVTLNRMNVLIRINNKPID